MSDALDVLGPELGRYQALLVGPGMGRDERTRELLADLLACAMVFPIIAGLYTGRLNGIGAAVASVLGILAGTPMFLAGQSLWSFLTALAISVVVTLLWSTIQKTNYDFDRLVTEITNLD